MPLFNPYALGNAWFVDEVKYVDNANEEIEALRSIDLARTVVVDKRFAGCVKSSVADSLNAITLKAYKPNALTYEVNTAKGGTVVFSEIYYPGWRSYVDGKEVEHGRADYVLRAMNVPAGKHTVEFVFDPQSLHVTEGIAFTALALLAVGVLLAIGLPWYRRRKA